MPKVLYLSVKLHQYSIAQLITKKDDRYKFSPKELLIDACSDNYETGSCTCCLATIDENADLLYTSNIGDSGYMLLRKQGVDLVQIHRSKEQQHSFNFPF